MRRALFSVLLVACALALPASANATTITFAQPDNLVLKSSAAVFSWSASPVPENPVLCQLGRTSPPVQELFALADCFGATGFSGGNQWNVSSYVTTDGTYDLVVKAMSFSGDDTKHRTFRIDNTAPEIEIETVPPANGYTTSSPSIEFAIEDDNEGSSECTLTKDGVEEAPVACSSPFEPTLADGAYGLLIKHTDLAGNTGFATTSFVIDTTPPTINLVGLTNGSVVPTPYPQYNLSAPGASSMQCFYDNDPSLTCEAIGASPTGLPDGAHTIHIIATDAAGNVASLVVSFTVDDSLAPPDLAPLPTGPRPSKVNLKKTKSVVSGSKVKTSFSGSFTIRGGGVDWTNACTGRVTVKFSAKVNGKTKTFRKAASLKRKGSSCTFKGTAKLPRAWKGKRVKTTVSHPGNAGLGKFSVSASLRI